MGSSPSVGDQQSQTHPAGPESEIMWRFWTHPQRQRAPDVCWTGTCFLHCPTVIAALTSAFVSMQHIRSCSRCARVMAELLRLLLHTCSCGWNQSQRAEDGARPQDDSCFLSDVEQNSLQTEFSPKRWGSAARRCSIYGEETEDDKRHMTRASPSHGAEVSRGCFGCRLRAFLNEASKRRRYG